MLRRGYAVLPFFLLTWVLRLTQALASAYDRLQDEAAANSMSGTGNLDRGGNLSLLTVLNISYAEDHFSKQDYFSPNGKGELSEIAGYSADQQRQSLDHVFSESDSTNDGLFDFSQHSRHDEDALEQPGFSNPDSDDFNSDLTKDSVLFVADEYHMASESEGDVEHVLFTDRSNDPDADFPEVFEHADVATSDKENVSSTLDLLEVHDSVIAVPTEMGIGEFGNEEFESSDKYKSETLGYDSVSFSDLEKEGTDTLHPDVHSYHREDLVTGDLNGMHVSSFDRSVLTDINLELEEALSPAFKIERAHNSPDLSGGHMLPTSVYDASIGSYGVFNLPITQQDPPLHSTGGEPTTLASATTCGVADMTINLFGGRLTDLKVRAPFILVEVSKIVQRCQYMVLEKNGVVIFTTAFKGCNVKALDGHHVLTLMWRNKYVNMSCPIPTPDRPITICGRSSMTIKLPAGPIEALRVKDKFNKWVSVYEVAVKCKYQLLSDSEGRITFTTSYNGCHVRRSMDRYFYNIYYQMAPGKLGQAVMSCKTGINVTVPPEESLPSVFCGKSGMMIKLPKGSLNAVKVRDGFGKAIPVRSIAKNCNYQLFQMKTGHIILIASFQSCQIAFVDGCFALSLQFQHAGHVMGEVSALCYAGEKPKPTSQPETPTTQEVTSSILSTVIPADVSATICNKDGMSVVLPSGPWWGIRVKDLSGKEIIVTSVVAERCHYELSLHLEKRIFTTTYTGCFVEQVGDRYVLTVMYRTATWNRGSVRMECPTSAGSPTELPRLPATVGKPITVCRSSNMTVVLPTGSLEKVLVLDEFNRTVKVIDAPKSCNYSLVERRGQILFTASYSACDVKILNGNYVLAIIYTTYSGDFASVQMECPTSGEPTKPPPSTKPIPPTPVCGASSMMVELPEGPLEQVKIMSKSNGLWVAVKDVAKNCNYTLMKERGRNIFITSYKACHVRILNKNYVLSIRYMRMGSAFFVNMRCPVTETTTGKSTKPAVVCRNTSMMVELPEGSLKLVQVIGKDNRPVDISDAFIKCGYLLVERGGKINLTAVYTACDVKIVNKNYTLMIIYTTASGKREIVQMSCPTRAVQPTAHTTRKPVTTEKSTKPTLPTTAVCKASSMTVELPSESLQVLLLNLSNEWVDINAAPSYCNYSLVQGRGGRNFFTTPYRACDVRIQNNYYYLTVLYTTALGKPGYVQVKCPSSAGPTTHPSTTTALVPDPIRTAICMSTSMMVELPEGARDVQIDKSNRTIIVGEAPRECGYSLLQRKGKYIFTAPYTACDIETQNENYYLTLIYFTATGKRRLVQMKCPATSPSTTTGKPTKPTPPPSAVCKASSMAVELPSGSLQILLLNPSNKWVDINDAPSYCNYTLSQERGRNFFVTPYTACDVRILNKSYVLKIWYMTIGGKKGYVVMTCPTSAGEPTEVPIPKTTTWEPTRMTRTTGRDSTGTTGGVPMKPTRMTRTTTRKPTRTTGGEPTKPTRTTGGEPTKPTRTTTWKPTRTTTKKPTRTTTRKPTRTTRTTTRKPTRTTGGEPTKPTKTTTRKPTRTTRTTTRKPTRTTTKKPTRITTRKPTRTTRTTTRKPTRTTTKKPTRITTRKPTRTTRTTTRKPTRTTTRKPTRTTRTTTRKPTRTTRTTTRKPTRTTTRKPTRTTGGEPTKPTKTTTRKPTRTTRTTTRKPTRTTGREPTKPTRPPTRKPSGSTGEPTKAPTTVVCAASSMVVALPKEPLKHVQFLDKSNKWVAVIYAPEYCNYTLLQGRGGNFFITPYTACDVRILNENYFLALRYTTIDGKVGYVQMKCPTSAAAPTKTPPSTTTTGKPTIPTVCKASIMTIELPEGPIGQVALIDKSNTLVTIIDDTRECGYNLVHERGKNIFTTPYTACDVKMLNGNYVLTLVYVSFTGKRVLVQMKCPTSAALPTGLLLPPFGVSVLCSDTCMTVELPGGLLQDIQLMDESNNLVAVTSAPKTCGYSLVRGNGKNILTAPYKACNVKILKNFYILRVLYTTLTGERGDIQAKCPVPGLVPREGCKIPRSQQVACGPPNADPQLCVANGCCVDATTSQCYYPLDACTADGHFVFAVYRTSTKPEIDPGSLVIAGNHSCAPVICTPDFAIFKFPVTGCGTHVFTVAETTIYLAEVEGLVRGNQQVYGQISRDGPYRLYVECRYSKGSLASTSYLVVNPPPPSAALSFGSLAVRLRIATDTSYTSIYPQSHLPLSFLLGSKVYLEVQLMNPPDPNVVLLVHYCIAYPQSTQAAWVILYEDCPNILDYSRAAGLHVQYDNMPVSKHTRRFEIQSFQFLNYKTKQYLDEEIYFMCSTEVCSPEHRVCNEGCFDGRDMSVPVDPGVGGRCAGKPCPGKSNIVKRAAHGHTGLIAVGEGTFILDENVPHEQTEKHWTYFHGLLGLLGLLVPVSVVMLFFKKWVVMQMVRSQRSSL
ncbi:uncharacterized protein LOC117407195 isoform X3 [Acipenser ruthenus]|uniref:uncharacterized protein LOC117407195 isoform X3 n=1 Tax=Acipenser ruthenus TaxID=7906 RepID=UPI002741C483|nr:uncharacterized protein LOC117407195 isoform X3 [Acipenser ruthenus]